MKLSTFTLFWVMTLLFLGAGCKAPPPPSSENTNQAGPPDKTRSLTVSCPAIKEVKGMIFDKATEADTFNVRGMKCRIELTRDETVSVDVVVKKSNGVLFFGTGFQVKNAPDSYKTAYKITFIYPGLKDVVFADVPIQSRRIEVPSVIFQDAK